MNQLYTGRAMIAINNVDKDILLLDSKPILPTSSKFIRTIRKSIIKITKSDQISEYWKKSVSTTNFS